MSPPGPSSPGRVFFCGVPVGGSVTGSSRRDCGCTTTTGGAGDSLFDGTAVDGFDVVVVVVVGALALPEEFVCGTTDDGILNGMTGGGRVGDATMVSVPETEVAAEQGDTTCMLSSGSSSLAREL